VHRPVTTILMDPQAIPAIPALMDPREILTPMDPQEILTLTDHLVRAATIITTRNIDCCGVRRLCIMTVTVARYATGWSKMRHDILYRFLRMRVVGLK